MMKYAFLNGYNPTPTSTWPYAYILAFMDSKNAPQSFQFPETSRSRGSDCPETPG